MVRRTLLLTLLLAFAAVCAVKVSAQTEEGWLIESFEASYEVRPDGSVQVVEDILVDFQDLQRHGIFRSIPVEYDYEPDQQYHRLITLRDIRVDDGSKSIPFSTSRVGANLELKIGDADVFVTGEQRYRISYVVTGALNSFETHDEFYWNVTGSQWAVPVQSARATLRAPAIAEVACFEGPLGSNLPCGSRDAGDGAAEFAAGDTLLPGEGLTIVTALPKGTVNVPPPQLVRQKSVWEQVRDFLGLSPLPLAGAGALLIGGLSLVGRQWWVAGRDRWFGDVHYLTGRKEQSIKPLFSRDTVVVEFAPPEIGRDKRPLRPGEIGVLIDEGADTVDVSATIVDLAVRGYLRITELEKSWLFGKTDYELTRLKPAGAELLPYEARLFNDLFEDGETVKMSDLRNNFYEDLAAVKNALYSQAVFSNKHFPSSPQKTRQKYLGVGIALVVAGAVAVFALGELFGAGVLGVPVIVAGLAMMLLAPAMPRRTAAGREAYRRALGFREFMVTAETDRQRFYEEENIFDKYLPYAIVFGCVDKWAKAFEGLEDEMQQTRSWYVGRGVLAPVAFAGMVNSFSSSISGAISSTPASSGGSGFSGGGFSGGGFGGGGGGSW